MIYPPDMCGHLLRNIRIGQLEFFRGQGDSRSPCRTSVRLRWEQISHHISAVVPLPAPLFLRKQGQLIRAQIDIFVLRRLVILSIGTGIQSIRKKMISCLAVRLLTDHWGTGLRDAPSTLQIFAWPFLPHVQSGLPRSNVSAVVRLKGTCHPRSPQDISLALARFHPEIR